MSGLLLDEVLLNYQPKLVRAIGLPEAAVIQQLHYWSKRSQNSHDGHVWVYKTYNDWADEIGLSAKAVRGVLDRLRTKGLVVSMQSPLDARDRTLWWRIDREALDALDEDEPGIPSAPEGSPQMSAGAPPNARGGSSHARVPDAVQRLRTEITAETALSSTSSTKSAKTSNDNAVIRDVFRYWQQTCGHPNAKLTQDRRSRVAARLREGFTADQIRTGVDGAARAAWVNDEGRRFDDLELICRSGSKLEGFIERASPPVVNGNGHRNGRNGNGYGRAPANEDLFQGLKAKVQANGNGHGPGPYVDAEARDIDVRGLLNGGPA